MIRVNGKNNSYEYDNKAILREEAEKKQANIYNKHLSIIGISIFNSGYMNALKNQRKENPERA